MSVCLHACKRNSLAGLVHFFSILCNRNSLARSSNIKENYIKIIIIIFCKYKRFIW